MATIEIPNVRQESTVLMPTTLKDNGVAVDWSGLQNIKAYMYSDAQRVIAGKCDVEVDGEDATVLKVTYAATRPQYLGVNSLLVRCKYHGREKSYDVPVLNFVERTAQATGVTELDDPVIDVKLEVNEVSTSLLDGAIAAALDAAAHAEEAAEAAEKKAQEQADWAQDDPYKVDYIKNKPEIPTNVVKYTQQILHPMAQAQARSNIGAGTYSKPGTGIPYNDLDEETRQAIEAADTTRVFYYDASTFEEVNDAISDGFVVIVDMEGVQLMHSGYDETKGIAFTGHSADDPDVLLCAYVNNSDEWSSEERPRDAEAVKYTSQTLTSEQKEQARTNIAAAAAAALSELASAVAAKYSKPANGIPSSDLDAAVQSALAKANSAIQDLSAYYTKTQVDQMLAAINAQNYETVAALPTASASTMGKIYLVGPDANSYYAYYISSYNGSAYSWVGPLGTTEINLAGYATKAELNQLDQKVDDLMQTVFEDGFYIIDSDRNIGFMVNTSGAHTEN